MNEQSNINVKNSQVQQSTTKKKSKKIFLMTLSIIILVYLGIGVWSVRAPLGFWNLPLRCEPWSQHINYVKAVEPSGKLGRGIIYFFNVGGAPTNKILEQVGILEDRCPVYESIEGLQF